MSKLKKPLNLALWLVLFVFGVMMTSLLIMWTLALILHGFGLWGLLMGGGDKNNRLLPMVAFLLLCIFLGTALTGFLSKKALDPIRRVIDATHKIAEGNFDVQIDIKGIRELEELSKSFNKMARELNSIETLRADFVNNFSHEFKTPIVSLRGFAKLLKEGNLSEEEKQEYLNIIINESERLAKLSNNVLSLAKYDNIKIITNRTTFQLDEQIRRVILMTEQKWASKDITMNIEMEEIYFNGNGDLSEQIWLNLIENAIKFSQNYSEIFIRLSNSEGFVRFIIEDKGEGMDEKTKLHIFDKFYQGDRSHSKSGNGLGLSIVKRIIDLYGGTIEVNSEIGKGSIFIVKLPNINFS